MRLSQLTLIWFIAAVTPGSTVLMIMSQALRGGLKAALRGLLGLQAGHALLLGSLYFAFHTAGGALSAALPWIQIFGAAYLIITGLLLLRGAFSSHTGKELPLPSMSGYFRQSFITHISNPKALLFSFAVVPAFLDKSKPLGPQMLVVAGMMMPLDFLVMGSYALLAARAGKVLEGRKAWLEGISGAVFLLLGAALLFE